MTCLEMKMKELGRRSRNNTQHNVDLYPSVMSQTSFSRKKPSRWKSINTYKHATM